MRERARSDEEHITRKARQPRWPRAWSLAVAGLFSLGIAACLATSCARLAPLADAELDHAAELGGHARPRSRSASLGPGFRSSGCGAGWALPPSGAAWETASRAGPGSPDLAGRPNRRGWTGRPTAGRTWPPAS